MQTRTSLGYPVITGPAMAHIDINTNYGMICPCPEIGESKWDVCMDGVPHRVADESMKPMLFREDRFLIYMSVDGLRFVVVDLKSKLGDWSQVCTIEDRRYQAKAMRFLALYCDEHQRQEWAQVHFSAGVARSTSEFAELNHDRLLEQIYDLNVAVHRIGLKDWRMT